MVYFQRDALGRDVVEKVFGGDTASKLVLYTLTGAPNPYIWNEHAIACAVARRTILAHLVRSWFGDRLSLPRTDGYAWNERHRAYAIHCEFIRGRHVPLRLAPPRAVIAHPLPKADPARPKDALTDLRLNIMKPLQHKLMEAGFDGLVWQAGMGNPVATNNFMLVEEQPSAAVRPEESQALAVLSLKWVWIDLESGVPALFPANPWKLLSFYLPATLKHRRPMFDDVDLPKLQGYLQSLFARDDHGFDAQAIEAMRTAMAQLESHQTAWKGMGRVDRSLTASLAMGRITQSQADWYARHRLAWLARLALTGMSTAVVRLVQVVGGAVGRALMFMGRLLGPDLFRFLTSQRFRARLSRRMVAMRIGAYEKRRQLLRADAMQLRRELRSDESTEYITDFGIHLSVKPFVKTSQYTLVPLALAAGWITPVMAVMLLAGIGSVVRTLYTLGRMGQAVVRRQALPWVALVVGVLPTVGTLAYPMQLAWAAEHEHRLARFIIDDSFATLGRRVPIWGGADTLTEHVFNRLPAWLARWLPGRKRRINRAAACPSSSQPA